MADKKYNPDSRLVKVKNTYDKTRDKRFAGDDGAPKHGEVLQFTVAEEGIVALVEAANLALEQGKTLTLRSYIDEREHKGSTFLSSYMLAQPTVQWSKNSGATRDDGKQKEQNTRSRAARSAAMPTVSES